MADQVMTGAANLSVIIPKVWSSRYYDVLLADLPFSSVVSRDWEGEIQDLGDTVNVSQFPEFDDGEELAEDAQADAGAITVSQIQLVINKRVFKDFIVTRLALLQSLEAMDKLRELAIYSILKKIEKTIIATIVPASGNGLSWASGTTCAFADILAAKKQLDSKNVPMGDRHGVFGSSQLNDVFNITGFTSSDFVLSAGALAKGMVQEMLLGFLPHMTTLAGNTGYFFHSSFMTAAFQQGMAVNQYDLGVDGKRAVRVNCDTLYGLKQMDGNRVVTKS